MMHNGFSAGCKYMPGIVLLLFFSLPVRADWSDWWRTPEQQAQAALEAKEFDKLKAIAPNADWQGAAQHKSEEFSAAAQTFAEVARQQQAAGDTTAANRALYNQGVSEVLAGEYEQAVERFDQVLEQDPEFADAQHNRDIAQQLIQQQQQQQQQSQDGEGDDSSSEEGEQQQSDSSGEEQSGEQQSSEQSESEEQSGEQSEDSGGQTGDDDSAQSESEAQQMQDEQAARDALDAEAQAQAAEAEQNETDAQNVGNQQSEQPLSESEQATEQWLRRIPDDPAGLLRRKLEQSHRTDYPEVRDAQEPW